jgi:hypothetical protein
MELELISIAYHRNGVAGVGFHVVTFVDNTHDGTRTNMVGIVFDGSGRCAVFDRDLLGQGEIAFGENSWRGDVYERELRGFIHAWENRPERGHAQAGRD